MSESNLSVALNTDDLLPFNLSLPKKKKQRRSRPYPNRLEAPVVSFKGSLPDPKKIPITFYSQYSFTQNGNGTKLPLPPIPFHPPNNEEGVNSQIIQQQMTEIINAKNLLILSLRLQISRKEEQQKSYRFWAEKEFKKSQNQNHELTSALQKNKKVLTTTSTQLENAFKEITSLKQQLAKERGNFVALINQNNNFATWMSLITGAGR